MPKIATEVLAGLRFNYHVSASGLFTCELDPATAKTLDVTSVGGETLEKCKQAVRKALQRAAEARTSSSKVIVFDVSACVNVYRDDRLVLSVGKAGQSTGSTMDGLSFCEGAGVSVWAAVAEEFVTTDPDGVVRYRYEIQKSSIPASATPGRAMNHVGKKAKRVIPWTAEREAFFSKLVTGMENIVLELSKLCGGIDDAILMIDNGGRKLLT